MSKLLDGWLTELDREERETGTGWLAVQRIQLRPLLDLVDTMGQALTRELPNHYRFCPGEDGPSHPSCHRCQVDDALAAWERAKGGD